MASVAAAEAFDREAETYDEAFGRNPVGLVFRYVVQEHVRRTFDHGARVLDLGCGTGDDAVFLATAGLRVHALDVSPAMVSRARAKAAAAGLGDDRLVVEQRAAEDLLELGGSFDGAYSNFGALNCANLEAVGAGLAAVLRPGAPVVSSLMGPWPLPATLERALTGRGEARRRSAPRVGGLPVPVRYPSPWEVHRLFGSAFAWRGGFGLGVLMPGPQHAGWARRHPQLFGLLASLEGVVRGWPVLRSLGDHVVLEGVRR